MESKKIKRLVKGLLTDKLSWKEKHELSKHKVIEKKMIQQWEAVGGKSCDPEMGERIWLRLEEFRKADLHRNRFSFQRFLVAASIILFVVGGSLWMLKQSWNNKPEYINFVADKALMYMLPDSSKVWMQTGSKVRYAENFQSHREVWLEGDALFDVTKGMKNNFKVYISKAFIEVKGTSFLVKKNQQNKKEVTLFEGKVEFNVNATGTCVTMKPMEKITYDPETAEVTMAKVEHMDWDNGRYLFTDITLEHLVEIINQKYNSHIILGKNINKTHKYTGSISHGEPLEKVIEKLCYTMGLNVEKQGEEILIH